MGKETMAQTEQKLIWWWYMDRVPLWQAGSTVKFQLVHLPWPPLMSFQLFSSICVGDVYVLQNWFCLVVICAPLVDFGCCETRLTSILSRCIPHSREVAAHWLNKYLLTPYYGGVLHGPIVRTFLNERSQHAYGWTFNYILSKRAKH